MTVDTLTCLMSWYRDQCDGDWEHQYGVEIGTLDNPGWSFAVDLLDTKFEGRTVDRVVQERSDDDWIHLWSDGVKFHVACGPTNLGEAIEAFCKFISRRT
jgi:hypothetical protein